jgi:hypothetical protein
VPCDACLAAIASASNGDGIQYGRLSDDEELAILKQFVKVQAVESNRWANITRNLLSTDLDDAAG